MGVTLRGYLRQSASPNTVLWNKDPGNNHGRSIEEKMCKVRCLRRFWSFVASPHSTFPLRGLSASSSQAFFRVLILPQFLATAGPPVANMTTGGITLVLRM